MKKTASVFAVFVLSLCASAETQENTSYEKALTAYADGDFKTARKLLLEHEYADDAKSRLADFLLANIAASDGDINLARERFARSFKNLPEGNELILAQTFAKFTDANLLYGFQVELMTPFYENHKAIFSLDSLLYYRYAKALYETSRPDEASLVITEMWNKFKDDPAADGSDYLIFNPVLSALVFAGLQPSETPVGQARYKAMSGDTEDFTLPGDAGLGLTLWAFENAKKASIEDLERAIEAYEGSAFEWRAWKRLAKHAFNEGLYELANGFASRALTLAPDDISEVWRIHILQGDSLRFLKQYDDARKSYQNAYMNPSIHGSAAAEAIYKSGLSYYDEGRWNDSYPYFERVFLGYGGFDYWSSRAYFYAAKSRIEAGDNIGARNILREYLKYSKNRDTKVFRDAEILYMNTKIQ